MVVNGGGFEEMGAMQSSGGYVQQQFAGFDAEMQL